MPHIPHATRYFFIFLVLSLIGCTHPSLHEAQTIVAEADSLWHAGQMYGVDEGDSVSLAQSYQTLARWRWFHADEYAHCSYHYGKLLRAKDNPVEAMQAFINATHSGTYDYHILGRVYSNMGDMCHLAGDYDLSYDMFEKSANSFLKNGDTLSYYYALTDMAYETAVQKDTLQTQRLLDSIQKYNHSDVNLKAQEAKATLCLCNGQYRRAISVIDSMQSDGYNDLLGYLMKAQAFEHLNQMDSALHYANLLVILTTDNRYLISAYYILYNDDEGLSADSILTLSSARADAQKEWAQQNGMFSKAAKLLELDLSRKPDLLWLYAVAVILLVIGLLLLVYIRKKRRKLQLLAQQIDNLSEIHLTEEKRHQQSLEEHLKYIERLEEQIEQTCMTYYQSQSFVEDLHFKDFDAMCKIVDSNFGMLATKLKTLYSLSEKEIRLCTLVLVGVTDSKQLASMLYYAESGIRNFKNRIAKKLGTNSVELRNRLINIAIGEYKK